MSSRTFLLTAICHNYRLKFLVTRPFNSLFLKQNEVILINTEEEKIFLFDLFVNEH